MRLLALVFLLTYCSCTGQVLDAILPGFARSVRKLSDSLSRFQLLQDANRLTGDALATTLNTVSSVPLAISRYLGVSTLPSLLTDKNVLDHSDGILQNFKLGLGNEDVHMDITHLIMKYGYAVEEHDVITSDGYVLMMHRIPGNGAVVLLMHGLLGSSDDFVVAGPDAGLAYLLADAGYDVWMGNSRGNKHSRRHSELHPSEALFWDFSWHEIGCHDLPAFINYTLDFTGEETLKYIGHSQGTTAFFVMASERPEYNDKVSLMIALSPVAFMSHAKSPLIRMLAPHGPVIQSVSKSFGIYEFFPDNAVTTALRQVMCGLGPLSEVLCGNIVFMMTGFSLDQLNVMNLPVLFGHLPSGASMKQFAHYGQLVVSGHFRQFDYGTEENLQRYGSEVPPGYPLERITAPVSLFYSGEDWLAHPIDVDALYSRLNNCIDIHKVRSPFNHLDFFFGKDFVELIFQRVSKLLGSF